MRHCPRITQWSSSGASRHSFEQTAHLLALHYPRPRQTFLPTFSTPFKEGSESTSTPAQPSSARTLASATCRTSLSIVSWKVKLWFKLQTQVQKLEEEKVFLANKLRHVPSYVRQLWLGTAMKSGHLQCLLCACECTHLSGSDVAAASNRPSDTPTVLQSFLPVFPSHSVALSHFCLSLIFYFSTFFLSFCCCFCKVIARKMWVFFIEWDERAVGDLGHGMEHWMAWLWTLSGGAEKGDPSDSIDLISVQTQKFNWKVHRPIQLPTTFLLPKSYCISFADK